MLFYFKYDISKYIVQVLDTIINYVFIITSSLQSWSLIVCFFLFFQRKRYKFFFRLSIIQSEVFSLELDIPQVIHARSNPVGLK
jgi:hypothetical protein